MAVVPAADDPSLGKQVRHFRFIFTSREARGKNKQKIRSHLGPVSTPGERKAAKAKPEAKNPCLINN